MIFQEKKSANAGPSCGTVSYTHLDKILVKKDIQSDLSKELFAALKGLLIPVQRVPVAVSYTHLDVYKRQECEYDEAFRVTEQGIQNATALADFINEYLSDRQRVHADAALYAAAIEDPEVEDITRSAFESFLRRCEPFMDEQRAKILCAFMEGAIINSCFMGLPYDRETIQKAVSLILEEDHTAR